MAKFKIKNKNKREPAKLHSQKLPRNYRIIPERWKKDDAAFFAGAVCILLAIIFVTYNLFFNLSREGKLADKKVELARQELFWKEQVKLHPDFRDAYFSLAIVEYQLNNLDSAGENLQKSLALDPNFKEGKELQKKLNAQ